jgi:hypothetical protein
MRRRDFITLLGAAAAWPLMARAQTDDRVRVLLSRLLQLQADAAAAKIGQFINEIVSQIGWTTQLPWSAGTIEQRRFDALRLLRQVPAVTELALLDASGHEQLRVSRLPLAKDVVGSNLDLSAEPKFTEAVAHKVYYGPVYFVRRELVRDAAAERPPRDAAAESNPPLGVSGVGLYVHMEDGLVKVLAPIEGTPAAKAGIMAGDVVAKLDDEAVRGFVLRQVVEKLRGPAGTTIRLTIVRQGQDQPIEVSLTREQIRAGQNTSPSINQDASKTRSDAPVAAVEPAMTLSLAGTRRESGVSVAEVGLIWVWDVIRQAGAAAQGAVYVLDAQDRVIGHSSMFRPAFDTSGSPIDGDLGLLQRDFSAIAQVQAARAAGDGATQVRAARDIDDRDVLVASASVAQPGWHVFVELPLAEADTAVP